MKKLLTLAILFLLTSCLSSNYKPSTTYDLHPSENTPGISFTIDRVKLDAPYSKKLTYRKGNTLIEKEYHRWSDSPNVMLSRYWNLRKNSSPGPQFINAIIRTFEIDLNQKKAVLIIDLETSKGLERFSIRESITNESESSCVAAMKLAVEKLTQKISQLK